ncbi:MAG: hypothetical protein DRQ51_09185 [Gammaproteobacteria bacterium]|nr:MAG: hypothetical protein DRQ51_09185 [Gammaproteobacteria bacterium]
MIINNSRIEKLRDKYSSYSGADSLIRFCDAYKKYSISKKQSLIDLMLVSVNLTPAIFDDITNIDPLLQQAITETNPNFDTSSFFNFSDNEMMGIINSAKGKYFEYLVTDKLNSGEAVGDVMLPDGYQAVMATSATQAGWDIQIVDQNGYVADYLQLKATDSLGYINDTLEKYPDITILATDEVANQADGLVLNSQISEESLTQQVNNAVDNLDESLIGSFMDAFNPLLPLVIILASEGYNLSVGKQSLDIVLSSAYDRAERSVFAGGTGALVYALGGGLLSIPAVFIGGGLYDYYAENALSSYSFERATSRLKKYRIYQQEQILNRGNYGLAF